MQNNPQYYNKELGLMENEIIKKILEIISLKSKCYSILTVDDEKSKSKGISKNYCKKYHNHQYFKKYYLMN